MMNATTAILATLLLAPAQPAAPVGNAEPGTQAATIRKESTHTRRRLAEVEVQLRKGPTQELVDELNRILQEAGDDLIDVDGKQYIPARVFVHRYLGSLPASLLASYRNQIDPAALQLLEHGRSQRTSAPLRELLDRYFVSKHAEEALILLAGIALERGETRRASTYWQRLSPVPPADGLRFPDPKSPPATVLANLALCALQGGDRARAEEYLAELKAKHAEATGWLAGADGNLVERVDALLQNPPSRGMAVLSEPTATVGGDLSRTGAVVLNGPIQALTPSPEWATRIPSDAMANRAFYPAQVPPIGSVRSVAFHPVVLGNTVYIASAGRIHAFDLTTGQHQVAFDIRREDPFSVPSDDLVLPLRYDADFSLTAHGTSLYARLGAARIFARTPVNEPIVNRSSYLVRLVPDPQRGTLEPVWVMLPPTVAGATTSWEGAPVVHQGQLLAVYARLDGGRVIHTMTSYDASTHRPKWETELMESPGGPEFEQRTRHELITMSGDVAIFCSHGGAVAAVNTRTGKPQWAFRYPSQPRSPRQLVKRDLNPPVAYDGRIYLAPTDANKLYCLDAESGSLLWESPETEITTLVGVSQGKVICTLAAPVKGIRAFDAITGSYDAPHGWTVHDDPALGSYGRGLLTQDTFLWPTQSGLYFLQLANGMQKRQPLPGSYGNLAFANGYLLCATPTHMKAYAYPTDATPGSKPTPSPPRWVSNGTAPEISVVKLEKPGTSRLEHLSSMPLNLPLRVTSRTRDPGESFLEQDPPQKQRIAMRGSRQLVAMDPGLGQTFWSLDAMKRRDIDQPLWWPSHQFLPTVYADEEFVLAYTRTARLWLINASTGQVLRDDPAPPAEYLAKPIRLATGAFVLAEGPARIKAWSPYNSATAWVYQAGRKSSIRGEAPLYWQAGDSLFVAIKRNIGLEIDHLDAQSGRSRWPRGPVFLPIQHLEPEALACDADVLYIAARKQRIAIQRDTGEIAWSGKLTPEMDWQVIPTARSVLLVSRSARPNRAIPPLSQLGDHVQLRDLRLARLPGALMNFYDQAMDCTGLILACDKITGRELQRITLNSHGHRMQAHLLPNRLVISTGQSVYTID